MSALPTTPAALRAQAKPLVAARDFSQAAALLWQAVKLRPDDAETLNDLGNVLVNARQPEQAIVLLRQALRFSPADPRILSNLGLALADAGRFDDAEVAFLEALHLNSVLPSAHNNLAILYIMMARHEAALACLNYALALQPDYAAAKRNRALANLSLGNFADGWRDYDHLAFGLEPPPSPAPLWNGEPLQNKRLVLTCQQGLGDTLQFLRYAPLLKAQLAHTILECPAPLLDLLQTAPGIDEIIPQGAPLPPADLSIPVAALPRIFQTTLATIPPPLPLAAPADRLATWRARLAPHLAPKKHRIAIAWQGNPHHQWDRFRSLPLVLFESLAQLPDVQLISLQTGPGIEQIPAFQKLTAGALVVPEMTQHNLADLAALISLADTVITVDSASLHLAATLGKPTLVPLSLAADWRWLTSREDSPWYPTLRLFRQKKINDWKEVFHRIMQHLEFNISQITAPSASRRVNVIAGRQ